jgi:hypothetical protein
MLTEFRFLTFTHIHAYLRLEVGEFVEMTNMPNLLSRDCVFELLIGFIAERNYKELR